MKVYNLRCAASHAFEGWFASEDDFHAQLERKQVQCPVCDSSAVSRMPSAPRLNLSKVAQPPEVQDAARQLVEAWTAAAREVIAKTENVGDAFPEEARKIHYREAPERPIRGRASPEERDALAEEGIEVVALPLPVVPNDSLH